MAIVRNTHDPFREAENAIAALRAYIGPEDNRITRGGMYLLEIINQNAQHETQVSQRLPQTVFPGMPEGGRRHVAASALCRAEGRTDASQQDRILPSGYTRIQEVIGQWAERDGCWSETPEADQLRQGRTHRADLDGSEAHIYFDHGTKVYKTIDASHYITYEHLLDRISIHNAIFPETAMTVEGFGVREDAVDNTGFVVIISQPFVEGEAIADPAVVHEAMKARGFDLPDFAAGWFFVSEDGGLLLTDLHDNNCVLSPQGRVLVFDCEAALNTMPTFHGTHRIPELRYTEQGVRKVRAEVDSLLPAVMDREDLFRHLMPATEEDVREQLRKTGRYDGAVFGAEGYGSENRAYIIQNDPENPRQVLVSTPEKIGRMLRRCTPADDGTVFTEKELHRLSNGKGVTKGDTFYAFNLDKGRIDTMKQYQLKKKISSRKEQGFTL